MSLNNQYVGPVIFSGAKSPEVLRIKIRKGGLVTDLTLVTSVVLTVRDSLGSTRQWATTIESKTRDECIVVHTFDAQGNETSIPGRYRITPVLTLTGGGVRRAIPVIVTIVE